MTIKRILVTGAGGYIGTVLTESLLQRGYHVVALDRFFFGPTLDHLDDPNLTIVNDDIRWVGAELLHDIDAVCDLAAISNDPAGELDPTTTMSINAAGRARVARMAAAARVKRYVLASSCSVYGYQESPVTESSPVNPLTTYARANLQAEHAAFALSSKDFCVTALRQATVFGLSPRMRFDLVLNAMTLALLDTGTIAVQRDGTQWRPLVHVNDTARAFIQALEAPSERVNGELFNVGSDAQNVQMLPLAQEVAAALGVPLKVTWYGEEDHRSYRARFEKVRSVLGYTTHFEPADGVREIADAYRRNRTTTDAKMRTVERYRRLMQQGVL